jgi:hypothetical protein
MANEDEANNARQQHGRELMKKGVHAVGVEQQETDGKNGWVVVAHVAPESNVKLPSSLSYSTKEGEVEVPLVVARTKPYTLE